MALAGLVGQLEAAHAALLAQVGVQVVVVVVLLAGSEPSPASHCHLPTVNNHSWTPGRLPALLVRGRDSEGGGPGTPFTDQHTLHTPRRSCAGQDVYGGAGRTARGAREDMTACALARVSVLGSDCANPFL